MERLIRFSLLALKFIFVCFAIYKTICIFKPLKLASVGKIKNNLTDRFSLNNIPCALTGVLAYLFLIKPDSHNYDSVRKFKRVFGSSVLYNIDVSRRIQNFFIWFLAAAILFFVFMLFIEELKRKFSSSECQKVWKFIGRFSIIALCSAVFEGINFFNSSSVSYLYELVFLIYSLAFIYIIFSIEEKVSAENFFALCACAVLAAIPFYLCIPSIFYRPSLLLMIQYFFSYGIILLLKVLPAKKNILIQKENLAEHYFVFLACVPAFLSVFIESISVLNQHEIFIGHPKKVFALLFAFSFIVFSVLNLMLTQNNSRHFDSKKYAYPLLIWGFALLTWQVPSSFARYPDWFEHANAATLISDFLNFNIIPIVGHYGGHMMSGVWEGIFYGIINNDFYNAGFSPYGGWLSNPLEFLVFFFFLKTFLDRDTSFFATLMIPFYGTVSYFILGLLIAVALVKYIRKNSFYNICLVWLACVWCTLYRLDLGFAFDAACLAVLVVYSFYNRKDIKQIVLSFMLVAGFFFVLWCVLCLISSVNPIVRLLEFIKISSSNNHWAYTEIGNKGLTAYSVFYLFVPVTVAVSLVTVFASKSLRIKIGIESLCLLVFLGIAFFANYPRSLVRHSLAESQYRIAMFTFSLFLSLLIALIKSKKCFVPVFISCSLMLTFFATHGNFSERCVLTSGTNNIVNINSFWSSEFWQNIKNNKQKINRVTVAGNVMNKASRLDKVFSLLLKEDETFVDFMNASSLYSIIGRKCPVYVSQTPMMLSGEFSQKCFIKEIESDIQKIPLAIFPARSTHSIDGINNEFRYYKVAEFSYQNYVPLCAIDEFAIWCLKNRFDEFEENLIFDSQFSENILLPEQNPSFDLNNCSCRMEGSCFVLKATGNDPFIRNFSDFISLQNLDSEYCSLEIEYESSASGIMQVFFTDRKNENFSEDKSDKRNIEKGYGLAKFAVRITPDSRIRLDIPDNSEVEIKSVRFSPDFEFITFGYDQSFEHSQYIAWLPYIWGKLDKARNNRVVLQGTKSAENKNIFVISQTDNIDKSTGNYLKLLIDTDVAKDIAVYLGTVDGSGFKNFFNYRFMISPKNKEYLIRISSDYYWYFENINAVMVDDCISDKTSVSILEGD